MDVFSKNKLLVRLVIVLIVLNVVSIAMMWYAKHDRNAPPPPPVNEHNKDNLLQTLGDELSLNEEQKSKLKQIREEFYSYEKPLSQLIRSQRDSMNLILFSSTTDSILVNNLARRVADNEYKMEKYRIHQAKQLQSICTADQLNKLNNLVIEIRDYFQPKKNEGKAPE